MDTVADLVGRRADDGGTGLLFEDRRWSWSECVTEMARRAAWLRAELPGEGATVGVLLENTPEFHFWLGACALAGATLVGLNPTRRGGLEHDVAHTGCRIVLAEPATRAVLDGLDLPAPVVDPEHLDLPTAGLGAGAPVEPSTRLLLLFTSGTTAAPRAVVCTQGRLAGIGGRAGARFGLHADDVAYCAMPLFHSNALMACWAPALATGAALALRRRFSASGFLDDVRRFGATYANYVGKPLAYILATPPRPDDADNDLRLVFGNEAAHADIDRFARRFGCTVIDGYGSTEGVINLSRAPGMPPGAIGRAGDGVVIRDPGTGRPCPPARFDETGRLLNPGEAVGEITSRAVEGFEGYHDNAAADRQRVRDGSYWSGDLGYVDGDGLMYFAGRRDDWIRVDGENLAVAPIERILGRYPPVSVAAVYGVPDPLVGDEVMAALQLAPGAAFDPVGFAAFLADQPDLGTKSVPRYVRVTLRLPTTVTNKVRIAGLRALGLAAREGDELWWRPARAGPYQPLTG